MFFGHPRAINPTTDQRSLMRTLGAEGVDTSCSYADGETDVGLSNLSILITATIAAVFSNSAASPCPHARSLSLRADFVFGFVKQGVDGQPVDDLLPDNAIGGL